MSFINNLKMKNKLILMLIFPVLGLLYFSVNGIWEKYTTARAMRDVQNLSHLAVNISAMVHELQKERGATGVFVGSKGAKFTSELSEQRSDTDRKISDFQTFLSAFQKDRYGVEFKKLLETALGSLEEIKTKRGMASAITVSGDEIVSYYTKMIGQFYDPISYMTQISANADIAVAAAAYANFLFAKEKTGIERAILSNTFAMDSFGPGVFKKLVSAVSAQETYLNMFLFVANAEQKDFYKNKMQGQVI
ncbi:MAG: nitrate- and nitrite sensing domain-containing protein, partial [Deltaproteobacteria bacterium]